MAGSDLVISVGASIKDLERQMKAASKAAEQAADEIEGKFKRVNPTIDFGVGILKGAVAAASIEKITTAFIAANKEIASFGETAKRVGLDVAEFQKLRLAGQGEGLSGKSFDSGIEGLAEKLNEARTKENDLTKLFELNNVKLRDRKGEVISTNEALNQAAELIRRAATEMDKVDIAKMVGLSKEWVPLLENGAKALADAKNKAAEAGTILEKEIIEKAAEFDKAWEQGWAAFATNAKAATAPVLEALQALVNKAREIGAAIPKSLEQARAGAAEREVAAIEANLARDPGRTPQQRRGLEEQLERARATLRASQGRQQLLDDAVPSIPLVSIPRDPEKPTVKPTDEKKTGGGGGKSSGKSEEEAAQDRLERYIETLMRQNSVLDAEIATFGKSNAEKRAAVELAKAQVDLAKLDETERQKIIANLTKEIELSEQKRTKLESLKSAQQGLTDAQKYFGNAAVDALEDLIVNGAKAEDVVKRLAASLAKAALQALLIGEGPLAGLFGTKGVGGSAGGILGGFNLFGRATGGPVNAGQPYRVGERGPETFVPTTPGKIVPNSAGGGGPVSLRVINNGPPMNASVQQRSDGNLDVILDQIESGIAGRAASGRSPLNAVWRRDAGTMRG